MVRRLNASIQIDEGLQQMSEDRLCPICGTSSSEASLFLKDSIDRTRMSEFSYASRKTPEFMSHLLVACPCCDLVFAPSPPPSSTLAEAYHSAAFGSTSEAQDASASYGYALRQSIKGLRRVDTALEIGTGTGAFLTRLSSEFGFKSVTGVEPSRAAIEAADWSIRSHIREGVFKETDFVENSFDLICCFMTLEHVADPRVITESVYRLLRPGGAFAIVVHDRRALFNRLLGKRSPIIDVEHLQLFSRKSAAALLEETGFVNLKVDSFRNSYQIGYWLRLFPIALVRKLGHSERRALQSLLKRKLSLNVGNLFCVGFKPDQSADCEQRDFS